MNYEVKTRKMRSLLAPRWWEFRRRYRWWRLDREVAKERRKLTPEARELLDDLNREMERRILFGNDSSFDT